ncbi:MAG: glycosyltransferase family 4 protein [bacterium]
MRILLVSIYDVARSGGLSSHVEEVASAFSAAGHTVRVLTPYTARPAWRRRAVMDLPRLALRVVDRDAAYRYFLASARRRLAAAIDAALARDGADVIHAHDPVALLASRDALARRAAPPAAAAVGETPRARRAAIPCVLTVHGDIGNMAASDGAVRPGGRGRQTAERLEALAYASADALITADERLRRHCIALAPRCAPLAFPNFVDVDRFRPARDGDEPELLRARRSTGLGAAERFVLVPRRLVKKTGVVFAVRAMAHESLARPPHDAVVLAIAGDGPERAEIAREAEQLALGGPGGRVRILGDVPRAVLASLYRAADAIAIPSISHAGVIEATSISALEAMATGKVVVASRIGGLAELIDDGRTGLLVPEGDAPALAGALRRVLDEPESSAAIGRSAREYVERERSTTACARRLLEFYARAASGAP